ncbi:hypothetical protein [Paraburkholderia bannensis]|uniref:hypothetical protein n=1 Tax=Paraburkholderia bannensis TaxID=765414 RepID=UPI00048904FD|nr:hypothetical protein [Paraburkholderia bannensis]
MQTSNTRTAIQSSWEIFERRTVAADATAAERAAARRAFFAGFHTMLFLSQQLTPLEPARAAVVLEAVANEAAEFALAPY